MGKELSIRNMNRGLPEAASYSSSVIESARSSGIQP
jgi:hypothetical protein